MAEEESVESLGASIVYMQRHIEQIKTVLAGLETDLDNSQDAARTKAKAALKGVYEEALASGMEVLRAWQHRKEALMRGTADRGGSDGPGGGPGIRAIILDNKRRASSAKLRPGHRTFTL